MIKCKMCDFEGEVLSGHIIEEHKISRQAYVGKFPGAALLSSKAKALLAKRTARAESGKTKFNIKKTFGVKFDAKKEIDGMMETQSTTPAIDPAYVFSKETLLAVLAGIELKDERVFLTGHTGSGKSSVVQQACARLNLSFCRINCDNDITRADFIGQWVLKGEEMEFQYGLLPRAMQEGQVLLLDEIDAANPGVAMVLQSILEKDGKLTIPETGESITPHGDFRIFATGNTKGQGDESGLYNGTQPQNGAMLDRFTWVEIVNYPDAPVEKKIIKSVTGVGPDIALNLVKVAAIVRKAFENGDITISMSTRTLINIANKIKMFGDIEKAYTVAFINKCDSEDIELVTEAKQRVWG